MALAQSHPKSVKSMRCYMITKAPGRGLGTSGARLKRTIALAMGRGRATYKRPIDDRHRPPEQQVGAASVHERDAVRLKVCHNKEQLTLGCPNCNPFDERIALGKGGPEAVARV